MFTYRKLILLLVLHMYVPARNCSLKIQKRLLASYWRKVQQILTHICDQHSTYVHTYYATPKCNGPNAHLGETIS